VDDKIKRDAEKRTLDVNKQYEQLNERSRCYSSQLWYVPFAFVGILALGIDKLTALQEPLRSPAFIFLSLFSLAVYIHVTSLKFYERRCVLAMQQLEQPVVSGAGEPWYLSFNTYIKFILIVGALGLLWIGSVNWHWILRTVLMAALIVIITSVLWADRNRTQPVLNNIRTNM
jgi:Flp pilus assembly protein TadB